MSAVAESGKGLWLLSALFLYLSVTTVLSVRGDHCMQLSTCGDCISSHFECKWCLDATYNGTRCVNASTNGDQIGCRTGFENPEGSVRKVQDDAFSTSIQVHPQHLSLQLRPGVPTSFEVTVKPASNFPLDVYFLLDFSRRENLASLQNLVYGTVRTIRRISSNYHVGFGSFVDKRTFPMMGATFWERRNPCVRLGYSCERTYSYHHHLSLTSNAQEFYTTVQGATTSGNFDPPEGGADALLQAVVCTDVIGWRPAPSRRLLVYISDDEMHFSYDGKLGGVVIPHDGKCHTTRAYTDRGFQLPYSDYTADTRLDYPSLSMIIAKLQEHQIYPVFAVSNHSSDPTKATAVYQLYQNISASIPFSAVEQVSNDSSGIVAALDRAYLRISSQVRLSVAQGDLDNMDVTFEADCDGTGWTDNNTCDGVLVGDETSFRVSVTAKGCTPELRNGSRLILSSGFFGSVVVDVQAICECNCSEAPVKDAAVCNSNGSLTCGTCDCNEGRYGRFCECGAYENGTIPQCPIGRNGESCSGPLAGECYCGQCQCNKNVGGVVGHYYFGEACECNNFECNKDTHGRMCSGHGTCECGGVCECDKAPSGRPYTGEICECYPDVDVCQAPTEDIPCSGHGSCECGLCKCQPGYSGQYCQDCISREICGPPKCSDFDNCISCLFTIVGTSLVQQDRGACLYLCNDIEVITTTDSSLVATLQGNSTLQCSDYRSSERCEGPVYYVQGRGKRLYVVEGSLRCAALPLSIPQWIMVVPIVAGLLIMAVVAIIVAKLIIVFMDYREYRAFKESVRRVNFPETENPLYKSAWQTFYCPMYPGYLEQGLVGTTLAIQRSWSLPSIRDDEADGDKDTVTISSGHQESESPQARLRAKPSVTFLIAPDGHNSPSLQLRSRDAEGPSILVAMSSDSDSAKSEDPLLQECNIEDLIQTLSSSERYNPKET